MAAPIEHIVRWTAPARKKEKEQVLQDALGVPSLVAAVLVNRGYDTPETAHEFLNPSLDNLGDPEKLPDYVAARNEILKARDNGDLIYVHGDYDVDGVTSAALLTRFLQSIKCKVKVHVPHRMREGYGIHLMAVEEAKQAGAKLFLTCDCGVSAHEQVEAAKAAGMRVVVTDHHTIGETLPEAHAMVNPHREGSEYPFQELSGVGVAFRLCEGLTTELGFKKDNYRRAFLDLTVLGTVADVMPLVGENRIITRHGLGYLLESKKEGIRALLRESGLLEENRGLLKARDIGFILGPRLNAAGRIDDAARSLNLLLTGSNADAKQMAETIEVINKNRREKQNEIVEEAVKRVMAEGLHEGSAIVIGENNWHPGIIGLVAGRLVEKFRRPAFVLSIDPETGEARGSARSIPGFHLADAIRAHPELVVGGGHAMAAGFSTTAAQIPEVAKAFELYASTRLCPADFELTLSVEAEVEPNEVTFATVSALEAIEPYGNANEEPMFALGGVSVARVEQTKSPDHPRLVIRPSDGTGAVVKGMAFGQGSKVARYEEGFEAQMLIIPKIEEWRGVRSMKWEIKYFEAGANAKLKEEKLLPA